MVSEFEFIQNIKARHSLEKIGDDCAVLPKDEHTDLLITVDLLIEDIDFRLEWTQPEALGHKALAVSLSDIAAMGGTPKWGLLSIGVPESLWGSDFIEKFYVGWHKLAEQFDVELVGGDVSRSPDKLVVDSIVGGEVDHGTAILRSGASPRDLIVVTGPLGAGAGGLQLLEASRDDFNGQDWAERLIQNQLRPTPQVAKANYLHKHGLATSMIDLSDGVSSDLRHICDTSNVGARIYADKIPVDPKLANIASTTEAQLDLALNGGEDYELLFTVGEENFSRLDEGQFIVIGEITPNVGTIELIRDGVAVILEPKGHRHF